MSSFANESLMLKYFYQLNEVQQKRVFAFIESLVKKKELKTKDQLLRYAGIFSSENADEITDIIESGCEKIDLNEW